jgi:DNA-binding transcriptional LysR family regulator
MHNDALLPALHNGEIDVAVTHTRQLSQPDVTMELVREDEFVAYCASAHRLAKRKFVRLDDLSQERWAVASSATGDLGPFRLLQQALEEKGLPVPRIVLVSDLVSFRLRAIAGSDLLGVAVRKMVQTAPARLRLKVLAVKGLDWRRPAAVAYRKDAYLSPATLRFIDILKAISRDESGRL